MRWAIHWRSVSPVGNAHDITQAEPLAAQVAPLLGDKGYDADSSSTALKSALSKPSSRRNQTARSNGPATSRSMPSEISWSGSSMPSNTFEVSRHATKDRAQLPCRIASGLRNSLGSNNDSP